VRRCDLFALLLATGLGLVLVAGLWGESRKSEQLPVRERNRQLVRSLQLTDLALFTEARYTRHLTQADGHAAFQDHPLALEHFPSGSLLAPPRPWRAQP
jgi:hypothetical protein